MRPAVACQQAPLGQAARIQAVDQNHEIGALDAERVGNLGLFAARIVGDQRQHRELSRPQVEVGEMQIELLEDMHLRTAQAVADDAAHGLAPEVSVCRRLHIIHCDSFRSIARISLPGFVSGKRRSPTLW